MTVPTLRFRRGSTAFQDTRRVMRSQRVQGRALAVTATVAVVATLGACTVEPSRQEASAAVVAFFELLHEGDAEAALALAGPVWRQPQCPKLMTNSVYQTVANRPSDITIENTDSRGPNRVEVAVSYRLGEGGTGATDVVTVERESTGDPWHVSFDYSAGFGAVTLDPVAEVFAGDQIRVQSACTLTSSSRVIWALPGTYTVEYVDEIGLAAPETIESTVSSRSAPSEPFELNPELSEGGEREVLALLSHSVDLCVRERLVGDSCPSALAWGDLPPVRASRVGDPAFAWDTSAFREQRWVLVANPDEGKVFAYARGADGSEEEIPAAYTGPLSRHADGTLVCGDATSG